MIEFLLAWIRSDSLMFALVVLLAFCLIGVVMCLLEVALEHLARRFFPTRFRWWMMGE